MHGNQADESQVGAARRLAVGEIDMFTSLLNVFFGCWHTHYSFPITVRKGSRRIKAASLTGTYVVCLDCGRELPYDWNEMKVVSRSSAGRKAVPSLATKEAA